MVLNTARVKSTVQRRVLRGIAVTDAALVVTFVFAYYPLSALPLVASLKHVRFLRVIAALWCFGSTAAYLIYLVYDALSAKAARTDPARRWLLQSAGSALVASPFALVGYGSLIERTNFRIQEVNLPVPDLPRDLEGLRLVQLSDIHLSPFLSEAELARVIDASNELRPHLAVVTGDLISSLGDPLQACLNQLARLKADAGVLGCLGNHEIYARVQGLAASLGARLGLEFLRNQSCCGLGRAGSTWRVWITSGCRCALTT
jgi:hypothetical protein